MSETISLTVIIITYNEERFIAGILRALTGQTRKDFETIVVDSNSSDNTKAVAVDAATALDDFSFIQLGCTRGPAYGRNRGAEIAKAGILLFLDADTLIDPEFINHTLSELEKTGTDIATCRLEPMQGKTAARLGAMFLNTAMRLLRPIYSCGYGGCLFSTAEVHEKMNGFNEDIGICEDCNYIKRGRKAGFKFSILKEVFKTSERRAEREGSFKIMTTYISCHLRRMFTGKEIMKNDIDYDYGNFQE